MADTQSPSTTLPHEANGTIEPSSAMSDSKKDEVQKEDSIAPVEAKAETNGVHPLRHPWSFYFDDNNFGGLQADDYLSGMVNLGTFQSIQDFWRYYNHVEPALVRILQHGKFNLRLFKQSIKPLWEDPANVNGGHWSISCTKSEALKIWMEVLLATIGEQLFCSDSVCGCVFAQREKRREIQLWVEKEPSLAMVPAHCKPSPAPGSEKVPELNPDAIESVLAEELRKILKLQPGAAVTYCSHKPLMDDTAKGKHSKVKRKRDQGGTWPKQRIDAEVAKNKERKDRDDDSQSETDSTVSSPLASPRRGPKDLPSSSPHLGPTSSDPSYTRSLKIVPSRSYNSLSMNGNSAGSPLPSPRPRGPLSPKTPQPQRRGKQQQQQNGHGAQQQNSAPHPHKGEKDKDTNPKSPNLIARNPWKLPEGSQPQQQGQVKRKPYKTAPSLAAIMSAQEQEAKAESSAPASEKDPSAVNTGGEKTEKQPPAPGPTSPTASASASSTQHSTSAASDDASAELLAAMQLSSNPIDESQLQQLRPTSAGMVISVPMQEGSGSGSNTAAPVIIVSASEPAEPATLPVATSKLDTHSGIPSSSMLQPLAAAELAMLSKVQGKRLKGKTWTEGQNPRAGLSSRARQGMSGKPPVTIIDARDRDRADKETAEGEEIKLLIGQEEKHNVKPAQRKPQTISTAKSESNIVCGKVKLSAEVSGDIKSTDLASASVPTSLSSLSVSVSSSNSGNSPLSASLSEDEKGDTVGDLPELTADERATLARVRGKRTQAQSWPLAAPTLSHKPVKLTPGKVYLPMPDGSMLLPGSTVTVPTTAGSSSALGSLPTLKTLPNPQLAAISRERSAEPSPRSQSLSASAPFVRRPSGSEDKSPSHYRSIVLGMGLKSNNASGTTSPSGATPQSRSRSVSSAGLQPPTVTAATQPSPAATATTIASSSGQAMRRAVSEPSMANQGEHSHQQAESKSASAAGKGKNAGANASEPASAPPKGSGKKTLKPSSKQPEPSPEPSPRPLANANTNINSINSSGSNAKAKQQQEVTVNTPAPASVELAPVVSTSAVASSPVRDASPQPQAQPRSQGQSQNQQGMSSPKANGKKHGRSKSKAGPPNNQQNTNGSSTKSAAAAGSGPTGQGNNNANGSSGSHSNTNAGATAADGKAGKDSAVNSGTLRGIVFLVLCVAAAVGGMVMLLQLTRVIAPVQAATPDPNLAASMYAQEVPQSVFADQADEIYVVTGLASASHQVQQVVLVSTLLLSCLASAAL